MKQFILLLCLVLAGCATSQPKLSVEPKIKVPREFSRHRLTPNGESEHARYIEGYERGWGARMMNSARHIDCQIGPGDHTSSGCGASISGFTQGVLDAEDRISMLITHFGKETTHKLLLETYGDKLKEYPNQ